MSFKIESNYDYVFLEWGSCYTEAYEFFGMANNFDVNITGSYSQVNEFSLKDNYSTSNGSYTLTMKDWTEEKNGLEIDSDKPRNLDFG